MQKTGVIHTLILRKAEADGFCHFFGEGLDFFTREEIIIKITYINKKWEENKQVFCCYCT